MINSIKIFLIDEADFSRDGIFNYDNNYIGVGQHLLSNWTLLKVFINIWVEINYKDLVGPYVERVSKCISGF